jgi:hypothetical protein
MTLSKKHYQRLWFPEPGTGGAIPTRAESALTRAQFDAAMPQEFWREVVDRVAQEAPDTLLLAEAFWMMEGYFVRTLGMHRVYNSAFMNMLKAEDNAKYRTTIKNVLEFDPEILKRFVNFMNNPDEETAVAQFGKDDKYFGVCTMMITMPGLPMFGHGQVEGFTEKYGMEYRRAYWDEQPDPNLLGRHERELFPVMHRRHVFAEVKDFYLYDFYTAEGSVNEDIFAYSNRAGNPVGFMTAGADEERGLVVYHNRYAKAAGWIGKSVAYLDRSTRARAQKSLGEGLGLRNEDGYFCVFRDQVSGLEFIRNSRQLHEKGLYVELGAYQRHVFLDFREVRDNEWHHYAQLAAYLDGRGVPSIDEAMKETFLLPVHQAFKQLANAPTFSRLISARWVGQQQQADQAILDETEGKTLELLRQISRFVSAPGDQAAQAHEMRRELEAVLRLAASAGRTPTPDAQHATAKVKRGSGPTLAEYLAAPLDNDAYSPFGRGEVVASGSGAIYRWGILLSWWCVHSLGKVVVQQGFEAQSRSWIDEWLLGKVLARVLQDLGADEAAAWRGVAIVKWLTSQQSALESAGPDTAEGAYMLMEKLLQDDDLQQFLGVNRYRDVLWFNKEAFEQMVWWLLVAADVATRSRASAGRDVTDMSAIFQTGQRLLAAADGSGYQVEDLMRRLRPDESGLRRESRLGNAAAAKSRQAGRGRSKVRKEE